MVGGALVVGMFLLVLGWTEEIVSILIKEPGLVCGQGQMLGSTNTERKPPRSNHAQSLWPF